ncbi:hypothetical protein EV582_3076 [Duganella sp. BK701]|nr:hypothetical protein EV582_3076 [Duganella sp. BK701]
MMRYRAIEIQFILIMYVITGMNEASKESQWQR